MKRPFMFRQDVVPRLKEQYAESPHIVEIDKGIEGMPEAIEAVMDSTIVDQVILGGLTRAQNKKLSELAVPVTTRKGRIRYNNTDTPAGDYTRALLRPHMDEIREVTDNLWARVGPTNLPIARHADVSLMRTFGATIPPHRDSPIQDYVGRAADMRMFVRAAWTASMSFGSDKVHFGSERLADPQICDDGTFDLQTYFATPSAMLGAGYSHNLRSMSTVDAGRILLIPQVPTPAMHSVEFVNSAENQRGAAVIHNLAMVLPGPGTDREPGEHSLAPL